MKKIFLSFFILVFHASFCVSQNVKKRSIASIESLLLSEGGKINSFYQTNASFILADGISMTDRESKTIYLGKEDLDLFSSRLNISELRLLIRLILSHEIGHILQQELIIFSSQNDFIFETQADVYAGYYLQNSLIDENVDFYKNVFGNIFNVNRPFDQNFIDNSIKIDTEISKILNFFFDLGEEMDNGHHPVGKERKEAVKSGFQYAIAFRFKDFSGNKTDKFQLEKVTEFTNKLFESIDYNWPENFNTWSLRKAKKIIHFNGDLNKYITMNNISYSLDNLFKSTFFKFNLSLKNLSPYKILFSISVEAYPKNILGTDAESLSFPPYCKNEQVIINPFTVYDLSDSIRFEGNQFNMPIPKSPMTSDVKYSFELYDSSDLAKVPPKISFPIKRRNYVRNLPYIMHRIYNSTIDNCAELRASPYFVNEIGDSTTGFFLGSFSDWNNVIDIFKNRVSSAKIFFYQGNDSIRAQTIFESCRSQIQSLNFIDNQDVEHYGESPIDRTSFVGYEYVSLGRVPKVGNHYWPLLLQKSEESSVMLLFVNEKKQ